MYISIGTEKRVFVLEANPAFAAAAATSPSFIPRTIFRFLQIIPQTFNIINVPIVAPSIISVPILAVI